MRAARNRNNYIWLALLGLPYGLFQAVGQRLETDGYLDLRDGGMWISVFCAVLFWTIFLLAAVLIVRLVIEKRGQKEETAKSKTENPLGKKLAAGTLFSEKKWLLLAGLLLFVCWAVVLFGVFPGFFVYDAQDEFNEVAMRAFNTHHPLSHVLLLGGIICAGNKVFGSYNLGIACYMLFQMVVCLAVFLWILYSLDRKGASRRLQIGTLVFYAIFPLIPMYVLCSAKDTLYTLGLTAAIFMFAELYQNPESFCCEPGRGLRLGLLTAALTVSANLRNNGYYIVLVMVPVSVLAVVFRTRSAEQRRRLMSIGCTAAAVAAALVLSSGISFTLKTVTHASDEEHQEILSVPIQQLTRAYVKEPELFTEAEKEQLFHFLPEEVLDQYRPKLSDPVKARFDNAYYAKHSGEFLDLWLSIGKKTPGTYLNAWLMTCYGYVYPDAVIDTYTGNQVFTYVYGDSSYFGYETELPGLRTSFLPWVDRLFRYISLDASFQKLPVVRYLFSPGALCWFWLLGLGIFLVRRRWDLAAALLPAFLNLGTVLLGPGCLVRYVLIWWFALPVLCGILFQKTANGQSYSCR